MKYTYRDECFIRDRSDIYSFVRLGIWLCITLVVFLADAYLIFIKGTDGIGSPVVGGMLAIVVVVMAVLILRGIQKRRTRAFETRRKAMEEGVRYDGQIVNAGMEVEYETYEVEGENNRTETRSIKLPNYWIDVDYFNTELGETKRFRAVHLSKNLERFIGFGVDVYVWYEWSEYIHKDLMLTYIDASGLG